MGVESFSFPGLQSWKNNQNCKAYGDGLFSFISCDSALKQKQQDVSLFYLPPQGGEPVFAYGQTDRAEVSGSAVSYLCQQYPYKSGNVLCSYFDPVEQSTLIPLPWECSQKSISVDEVQISCQTSNQK